MELSTGEWVTFLLLLAACLGAGPVVVAHVRGTAAHLGQAVQLLASSSRFQARLAGGMHLTWGTLFFASLGVILGAVERPGARGVAGAAFLVVMLLDLSVFALGGHRS